MIIQPLVETIERSPIKPEEIVGKSSRKISRRNHGIVTNKIIGIEISESKEKFLSASVEKSLEEFLDGSLQ